MAGRMFSDQLRQAIRDCGLSRYELWQRTGIDQSTLSRFVRGRAGMTLQSVDLLIEELGLELGPRRKGGDRP